jgi:hypothetical protein
MGRVACALLILPAGMLAQRSAPSATLSAPMTRCIDSIPKTSPARLDASHQIYVEQETVVPQRDGRVLVAGAPVFVWKDAGGRYDLLAQDSLFGMIIDTSLVVHAVPPPMPGHPVDGMRAAPLPDGWWLATFAEVVPAQMPRRPTVLAMWAGETDGTRWRALTKLPMVADSLETMGMSDLVWRDGRARLAVPFARDRRRLVVLYALDRNGWTARIEDLGYMSYVQLALSPVRDLMALVRPMEGVARDHNSLFLYTKMPEDSTWTNTASIARGGRDPIYEPLFAGESPRVLSWRRKAEDTDSNDLWFVTLDERGDSISNPVHLGSGAKVASLASRHGHAVLATADRKWPNPTLQLYELGDASTIARQSMTTDYRGLLGVAVTPKNVILVAARAAASPRDPAVVSVLQTHAWRCR